MLVGPKEMAEGCHVHHVGIGLGHGHRRSVLILWNWTALLSGVVLFPTITGDGDAVVPFIVVGLGLLLYTLFHASVRRSTTQVS